MRRLLVAAVFSAMLAAACGSTARDQTPTASTSQAAALTNDTLVVGAPEGTRVIDANGKVVVDLGPVIGGPGWTVAFASDVDTAGNSFLRVIDARELSSHRFFRAASGGGGLCLSISNLQVRRGVRMDFG